jgi:hypothetical protein
MYTKRLVPIIVAVAFVGRLATASLAQQSPSQPATPRQTPTPSEKTMTIDCPPEAAAETPTGQAVGSPQGTGSGSGLTALPSSRASQRVDGAIKTISSTRTNRILEVGDVTLEVEPSTVILVGCKPGSTADLLPGTKIKAAYEVKDANRTVATVIEVES